MHQVQGEYPDYSHPRLKNGFHLNADKPFNPYNWQPPIHWTGYVGSEKVAFTQITPDSFNRESFDWQNFPEKLDFVKSYIVEAIDEAMRIMD